jgi:hypothetical protein
VDSPFAGILRNCVAFGIVSTMALGIVSTSLGSIQCVLGHNYSVAAKHEATTVGHILGIDYGKGGPFWRYEFSINGAKVVGRSQVCATPLAPGACLNGPVLVYYSYQPNSNSRLEDFAAASTHAYRFGKTALAIGFTFLVLSGAGICIVARKDKRKNDSDPEDKNGRSISDDLPDAIPY